MQRGNDGSKFMLFLIVWVIVLMVFLMVAMGMLSVIFDFDTDYAFAMLSSPLGTIAYQLAAFILPLAVWMAIKGEAVKPSFPTAELGGKNIIIIVALSFLLQPLMMMISGISGLFFTNDVAELMYTFQQHSFILQVIAIAVTPAICEELVFRGYIQSKYSNHTIKKAALINGLFFAIMHLNLQQFAYTFVLGVIFAYMVAYTRSIWAAILPHFIINGSQVTLSRLVFALAPAYAEHQVVEEFYGGLAISPEVQGIITFGVITLVLSPVVIVLFVEFFRHNKWRIAGESSQINAIDPVPQVSGYDYSSQVGSNPIPDWAKVHQESPYTPPGMVPHYAPPPIPTKPSLVDPYTIGVVAVFVVFVVLMFIGSA